MQIKGLDFYGYVLNKTYGETDLKGKFTFKPSQKIEHLLYVRGNPKSDKDFEFITCAVSHDIITQYKNIDFDPHDLPHCNHYFTWKNKFEVRLSYYGKKFATDWKKIRKGTEDYLQRMIVKEEERKLIFLKSNSSEPVSDEQIQSDVKYYKQFLK